MNPIFVDTGYLLALELANDANHHVAAEHWQRMVATPRALVTTSFVFAEVVTFFNSRGHHAKAVEIGNCLLQSSLMPLVYVDDAMFLEGWSYFQRHQDKAYSLTDCISFVVMEKSGISTAFAFDKHFRQAGFVTEP